MNLPTFVMLNRSESILWFPVNNGMSKGGISRISELIIPCNSRGGGEEEEEEEEELARGGDDVPSVILFGNRVLIVVLIRANIMRIIQS